MLLKLQDYTENHFALEELYMAELEFPGSDAHIESHNRFRTEIDQLVGEGGSWMTSFARSSPLF